ncbi:hypothetical protein L209DRAFT_85368 [Thermothelomyces heterothallicus CBS 203.75]
MAPFVDLFCRAQQHQHVDGDGGGEKEKKKKKQQAVNHLLRPSSTEHGALFVRQCILRIESVYAPISHLTHQTLWLLVRLSSPKNKRVLHAPVVITVTVAVGCRSTGRANLKPHSRAFSRSLGLLRALTLRPNAASRVEACAGTKSALRNSAMSRPPTTKRGERACSRQLFCRGAISDAAMLRCTTQVRKEEQRSRSLRQSLLQSCFSKKQLFSFTNEQDLYLVTYCAPARRRQGRTMAKASRGLDDREDATIEDGRRPVTCTDSVPSALVVIYGGLHGGIRHGMYSIRTYTFLPRGVSVCNPYLLLFPPIPPLHSN